MRSVVSVTSAADDENLTTLDRVKRELGLTSVDGVRDETLTDKIAEASSDIVAALGFRVVLESVTETFWHESYDQLPSKVVLDRTPVVSIASVTCDDIALDSSRYRIDPATGELFALDASGYPCVWFFYKSLVVSYDGGYLPPSEGDDSTLPKGIEGACIELVSSFWSAKGRDPTVKAEEVPGVISTQYWVGAVGEEGELPPGVVSKLSRFRRTGQA